MPWSRAAEKCSIFDGRSTKAETVFFNHGLGGEETNTIIADRSAFFLAMFTVPKLSPILRLRLVYSPAAKPAILVAVTIVVCRMRLIGRALLLRPTPVSLSRPGLG